MIFQRQQNQSNIYLHDIFFIIIIIHLFVLSYSTSI